LPLIGTWYRKNEDAGSCDSAHLPDRSILAIVEVPMNRQTSPTVRYARRPFEGMEVPFNRFSINVPLSEFDLDRPS
jgi:hypothetical protein